jgi:D-alanine-D-alanine ligase-like ATP-grasp enzyme
MEQNSFLFQQASRIGMSHSDLLHYVLKNSCKRQNIQYEGKPKEIKDDKKKEVSVLFGGSTSERQVSLMSGTNVWLKLRKSNTYNPKPYLLDFEENVWELPYTLILNHTVEEIIENAKNAGKNEKRIGNLAKIVRDELLLKEEDCTAPFFLPKKMTFQEFINKSKFVFLGLHGGSGEDGSIQKILKQKGVLFNGSDDKVSKLCMDKYATGDFIRNLNIEGISITSQKILKFRDIKNFVKTSDLWESLTKELDTKTLIVKPKNDGCSTGIAHLYTSEDLESYMKYMIRCESSIPAGVLTNQDTILEMPEGMSKEVLFEKFVETDSIKVKNGKLKYKRTSGLVEVTVGVLEENRKIYALNPSITVAEGEVLSLEEKFQGGTGINITPPPKEIVSEKALNRARVLISELATKIGIKGYARIDAFMDVKTGELLVIEVNTLPGLTPSTVLYHQGLAESPQVFPRELLEKIIKSSGY